jgi:hypothetical protein
MGEIPELSQHAQVESPLGPVAVELGVAAVRAADALADMPEWRGGTKRRWLPSDHLSFQATIEFAYEAHEAQARLYMPDEAEDSRDGIPLDWHLDNVHTNLPFSEAERHWLIRTFYFKRGSAPERDAAAVVVGEAECTGSTVDAGQERPLDGRKLLDRWWAWRRDVFEFEDELSIHAACKALCAIAEITVPNMVLSNQARHIAETNYVELRRWERVAREYGIAIVERRRQTREQRSARPTSSPPPPS